MLATAVLLLGSEACVLAIGAVRAFRRPALVTYDNRPGAAAVSAAFAIGFAILAAYIALLCVRRINAVRRYTRRRYV